MMDQIVEQPVSVRQKAVNGHTPQADRRGR